MRTFLAIVVALAGIVPVEAQEATISREMILPATAVQSTETSAVQASETKPKIFDAKFKILAGVVHGTSILDLHSTYATYKRDPYAYESNKFFAPFINRGPAVGYLASVAYDTGVVYVSARMRGSKYRIFRKTWWAVMAGQSVSSVLAARHNMKIPAVPKPGPSGQLRPGGSLVGG